MKKSGDKKPVSYNAIKKNSTLSSFIAQIKEKIEEKLKKDE